MMLTSAIRFLRNDWRKVVGASLLLCAFVIFFANAFCTFWLDCVCDTVGDELIKGMAIHFDELSPFSLLFSFFIDLQFVIPSLYLGQRMMKKSWNSINRWILFSTILVAMTGLATGGYTAYHSIDIITRINNGFKVLIDEIYDFDTISYIIIGMMISNLVMLVPWTRDIVNRPANTFGVRHYSLVISGAYVFEVFQFFAICIIGIDLLLL